MSTTQSLPTVIVLINTLAGAGAEKQVLLTVAGLNQLGFRCSVFWLKNSPQHRRTCLLQQVAREAGVSFHEPNTKSSRADLGQIFRIRAVLREHPDALLWTWGHRADLAGIVARIGFPRVRLIGSLRSARFDVIYKYRWFWFLLGKTHAAFISNSVRNIELVSRVLPGLPKRCAVIYNAIEPQFFGEPVSRFERPTRLKIAMLGNHFIKTKGYDIAIRVAELIRDKGIAAEMQIGGAPVAGESLAELVSKANVSNVITLHGSIQDPLAFLKDADAFLMLSRYEGTPNALLEAMSLGLPAICTRVGDVEALFGNNKYVRLIEGNAESALEAILEVWNNWEQTRGIAQAGRNRCRTAFDHNAMIRRTAMVLTAVRNGQSSCFGFADGRIDSKTASLG